MILYSLDVPEGPPKIKLDKTIYNPGEQLVAECTSPGSDPPPVLYWYLNGKQVSKVIILTFKNNIDIYVNPI